MKNLFLFLMLLSAQSWAGSDRITLGEPQYGGSGCPGGSASVALSPDQDELSILFDSFTVEAIDRKTVDRKSCNIAIPIHIPQGYSVSIFTVDYRGFNFLPRGARSSLNVNYFFADSSRGVRTTENFWGPLSEDFFVRDELEAEAVVWSRCGMDTNLRVNASMMVQTNRSREQATSTVDSVDISSGMVYHLKWKRCW